MAWGAAVSSTLLLASNNTSFAVPIPAGLTAGMLVSAKIQWVPLSTTVTPPDASWTQQVTVAANAQNISVWSHIATAADAAAAGTGTWTFTLGATGRIAARIDARTGGNNAAPVDGTPGGVYGTGQPACTLSLTLAGADWVEYITASGATGTVPTGPTGYTDNGGIKSQGGYYTDCATNDYSAAGPTGGVVYSSSPTSNNAVIMIAWLPASSSGNTAAISGTLGALGCGAAITAALAAAVAGGMGPNATAATVTKANAASVVASAAALASAGTGTASQAMAASSGLSLTPALTAAQIQALATTADFGSLSSSLVVEAVGGINTAAVDSTLGALASSATITAHAGVNTAAIAATLGALSAAGATNAQASIAGAGALALQSGVQFAASGTAALASAIGPLASALTLQPGAATLPVDARYFVAAPYRPFYAALAARSFYVMTNPNITPRFDTKDPRETVVLTFNGNADLDSDETLASVESTQISMASGVDPEAADVVSGAQINTAPIVVDGVSIAAGKAVQAIASAGLTNCSYLIAMTCTTSNPDKVLTLKGILPVSSS